MLDREKAREALRYQSHNARDWPQEEDIILDLLETCVTPAEFAGQSAREWALTEAHTHDQLEAEQAKVAAVLALHQPRHDEPGSLVDWTFCRTCGYELQPDPDGGFSIGPTRWPCATARACGVTG